MKVKAVFVEGEGSEQVFHMECNDGDGWEFNTLPAPQHLKPFPAVIDTEIFCYKCRGFLGFYSPENEELKRAVFQALDNAAENGYPVDDSLVEAYELAASDYDVGELLGLSEALPNVEPASWQITAVMMFVDEWKTFHAARLEKLETLIRT